MEGKENSKNIYFKEDAYQTDPSTPRLFLDRLAFNTRVVFLSKFSMCIIASRLKKGFMILLPGQNLLTIFLN